MAAKWTSFLENTTVPSNFAESKSKIEAFVNHHNEANTRIVLVTSGGTTVPLESRTVRYIDNFSVGTRGSSSAEYFLEKGYAVIFLHRCRSLQPYSRHFSRVSFLDILELKQNEGATANIHVKTDQVPALADILCKYQRVKERGTLLSVEFTTLGDYLYLLKTASEALNDLRNRAMLYLAAAVSDFYIPAAEMPEHKIQSTDGPLQISLQLVPKMLEPLVKEWVPNACVVSFKLETDPDILIRKSKRALDVYKHQMVVANILETRKREVAIVTNSEESWIRLSAEEFQSGVEIEKYIIEAVTERHTKCLEADL